jgi:ComF family protein
MHWRRRLQRGDNHAHYLAQIFSEQLGIPLLRGVKRQRYTQPQESLSKAQRRANLKRAFAVSSKLDLTGMRLAIVDDVMTTGATANALSQCLLNAGATQVHIWCLARTPLGD